MKRKMPWKVSCHQLTSTDVIDFNAVDELPVPLEAKEDNEQLTPDVSSPVLIRDRRDSASASADDSSGTFIQSLF